MRAERAPATFPCARLNLASEDDVGIRGTWATHPDAEAVERRRATITGLGAAHGRLRV